MMNLDKKVAVQLLCYVQSILQMFFKTNILQYFWSFIRRFGFQFLDCEITTTSGKLLTNKCFLVISDLIWKSIDHKIDGQCKIFMPSFNDNEIKKELRGFVVPREHALDPYQASCGQENQTLRISSSILQSQKKGPVLIDQIVERCEANQIPPRQLKGPVLNQIVKSCESNQISPKTVQVEKNFQCEHCGKVFSSSKQCRQHRYQVHKPANNHCCPLCGAGFKTKSILSNHYKTHNGLKSFSCEICSKVSPLPFYTLF